MPYCPSCHSEYRQEFTACKPCGDVPLVDELPKSKEIPEEDLPKTKPVGLASSTEVGQIIEVEGREVDLARICTIPRAHDFIDTLVKANVRCAMVPLAEVEFPDGTPRVEVRVYADDHQMAEELLRSAWKSTVTREGTEEGSSEAAIDECPACGAHVPLDVEECPDCGLVVGFSGDDEGDEAEA